MASKSRSYYSQFSSFDDYKSAEFRQVPLLPLVLPPPVPTFTVSCFPSGELSAAYFLSGSHLKINPPARAVSVTTENLSFRSVQKIRRATENSVSPWKSFVTLTFDSAQSELTDTGVVDQQWAKAQLIRFRKALTMKVNRQISCKLRHDDTLSASYYRHDNAFRYIWVAELQANGNIHFHFMFNKYFAVHYLTALWGQGNNAVDCKRIKNAQHASAYICKYITKEANGSKKQDSTIAGNRYNISALLREDSMPTKMSKYDEEAIQGKKLLALMKEMVESRGGRVIDSGFGMVIPRPCHRINYKDQKTGTFKTRRGVDYKLAPAFLDVTFGTMPF